MIRSVAIMLVGCLLLHPLLSLRLSECCCPSERSGIAELAAAAAPSSAGNEVPATCCEAGRSLDPTGLSQNPTDDPAESGSDDQPSDSCECPMACCGILKSVTASLPFSAIAWSSSVVEAAKGVDDARSHSPHLLGLRRPPIQTAAA